jgi:hypothetical protein
MENDKHHFNLRSVQNEKLVITKPSKPTTKYFRKSFDYSGPKIWNDILIHIKFEIQIL